VPGGRSKESKGCVDMMNRITSTYPDISLWKSVYGKLGYELMEMNGEFIGFDGLSDMRGSVHNWA